LTTSEKFDPRLTVVRDYNLYNRNSEKIEKKGVGKI
jgi:hypothetical protein